jgi:hypothetical protein
MVFTSKITDKWWDRPGQKLLNLVSWKILANLHAKKINALPIDEKLPRTQNYSQ